MSTSDNGIRCRSQCGASVSDDDAALRAGWSYLQITAGWRCGACNRALIAARDIVGGQGGFSADPLPPDSRGALPRETASSILPPSVKG
jgi:hypothetical protein